MYMYSTYSKRNECCNRSEESIRHERQGKQNPPQTTTLPPLCHTPRAARLRALKCVHHGASEHMLTAGTGALQNSGERVVATKGNCQTTENQETPCTAFPPSRVGGGLLGQRITPSNPPRRLISTTNESPLHTLQYVPAPCRSGYSREIPPGSLNTNNPLPTSHHHHPWSSSKHPRDSYPFTPPPFLSRVGPAIVVRRV